MTAPQTIKQRTITVPRAEGGDIVVRRMLWPAAKDFIARLVKHVASLGTKGEIVIAEILPRLTEIVQSSTELLEELVLASSDLTKEDLAKLDLLELSQVLEAAVTLNLGPELKKSWAGIAGTVMALAGDQVAPAVAAGAKTPTTRGGSSTPTSSMPATAPST